MEERTDAYDNSPEVLVIRRELMHFILPNLLFLVFAGLALYFRFDRFPIAKIIIPLVCIWVILRKIVDPPFLTSLKIDAIGFTCISQVGAMTIAWVDVKEFQVVRQGGFGRKYVVWEFTDKHPLRYRFEYPIKELTGNIDRLIPSRYGRKPQELADLMNRYRELSLGKQN